MSREFMRTVLEEDYRELCERAVRQMFLPALGLVLENVQYRQADSDEFSFGVKPNLKDGYDIWTDSRNSLKIIFARFTEKDNWELRTSIYDGDEFSLIYKEDEVELRFEFGIAAASTTRRRCYILDGIQFAGGRNKLFVLSSNHENDGDLAIYVNNRGFSYAPEIFYEFDKNFLWELIGEVANTIEQRVAKFEIFG